MTITELDKYIRTLIRTTGRYRTLKHLCKHLPLDVPPWQSEEDITVYTDEGGCLNEYVLSGEYVQRYEANPHRPIDFVTQTHKNNVPSLTWYLQNIKGFLYPNLND